VALELPLDFLHSLDVAHIRRWIQEFAQITEDREVVARFERAWESHLRGS
jgi:hypothetical protein